MGKGETVLSVVQEMRNLLKEFLKVTSAAPVKPICSKDGRFIRHADGKVDDSQQKLVWYPTLPERMTWEEAKKQCEKIGCRLPTTRELFSIADLDKHSPAIDKEMFPDTKTDDWYWTGDTCPWSAGSARVVLFDLGYVGDFSKGSTNYVRPVRSSQ